MKKYVENIRELFEKRSFAPISIVEILNDINNPDCQISPDKSDKELIKRVQKEFKTSKSDIDKFIFLLYGSLLKYILIDKNLAKEEYLSNLVDLNFNYLFNKQMIAVGDVLMLSLKRFYEDLSELLYFYDKSVLKGSIWNKTEDKQKLNLLWLSQVVFILYNTNKVFWEIYNKLVYIYKEAIKRGKLEVALTWNFSANHVFMNIAQTQDEFKRICDDFDKPLSEFLYEKGMKILNLNPVNREIPKDRPIKVGFVYDRIVFNSPFKVLYSLLKALLENNDGRRFEYYVYDIETMEKSQSSIDCIDMLEDLGIKYYNCGRNLPNDEIARGHLYRRVKKCMILRDRIVSDGIDILIMGSTNFHYIFLYSTRTAPKQVFWSHGNFVWDLIGIDKRISHCFARDTDFEFLDFSYPPAINVFYNPPVDMKKVDEERKKYPEDAFILGTIGRLVKTDSDEYLQAVAEIMHKCPDTIFIAAGTGDMTTIRNKVEKLGISERFFMPGFVDPHIYGHIIDLWLETFPLSHGESLLEFRYKKKGVIQLIDEEVLNRYLNEILDDKEIYDFMVEVSKLNNRSEIIKFLKDSPFVAFDREDYIEKALFILNHRELLDKFVNEDYTIFAGHLDIKYKKSINFFMRFLDSLC